jgi:hypothetical protein
MTPDQLRARADREQRIYAAPELAKMLRAGADAMEERERLRDFVSDFAAAKIEGLRYSGVIRSPEDEPDPVVDASEVWAWQEDALAALTPPADDYEFNDRYDAKWEARK